MTKFHVVPRIHTTKKIIFKVRGIHPKLVRYGKGYIKNFAD